MAASRFLPGSFHYTVFVNEVETKLPHSPEHPPRPAWRRLLETTEGHILSLGIVVALVGLIVMGLVAFWLPQTSRMIGAVKKQ